MAVAHCPSKAIVFGSTHGARRMKVLAWACWWVRQELKNCGIHCSLHGAIGRGARRGAPLVLCSEAEILRTARVVRNGPLGAQGRVTDDMGHWTRHWNIFAGCPGSREPTISCRQFHLGPARGGDQVSRPAGGGKGAQGGVVRRASSSVVTCDWTNSPTLLLTDAGEGRPRIGRLLAESRCRQKSVIKTAI